MKLASDILLSKGQDIWVVKPDDTVFDSLRRQGTGKITLVAGDDDISDWDQALFKISKIILLGGSDGQIVIDDDMHVIDFLALESVNEVLADATVPADTYDKIRFEVDWIKLVKLVDPEDPDAGILEEVFVEQSSHKVDVNPQGPFTVGEDENIVLEIDIDLEKSIKAHETGNGKWKFRPVIFLTVLTVEEPGGLIRVFGNETQTVSIQPVPAEDDVEEGEGSFKLCDIESMAEVNPLDDPEECVNVIVDGDTSVFMMVEMDGEEMLRQVSPVEIGQADHSAVVYGFIHVGSEDDDVSIDDDDLTIDAELVALGPVGEYIYTIIECEAEGPAEGELPHFPCEFETDDASVQPVAAEEEEDDVVVTVAMIKGSKLYNRDGEPAELDDIKDGADIEAEGDMVPDGDKDAMRDRLDAFVVFVDDEAEDEVEGMLEAIDLANSELLVIDEDDDTIEWCVAYDDDTVFFRVVNDDEDGKVESGIVTVDELVLGVDVEASGIFEDGCLQATEIILEVEGAETQPV